jgi:hypothetical protein
MGMSRRENEPVRGTKRGFSGNSSAWKGVSQKLVERAAKMCHMAHILGVFLS